MNGGLLGSLGVGRQDVVQVKEVACSRSNGLYPGFLSGALGRIEVKWNSLEVYVIW